MLYILLDNNQVKLLHVKKSLLGQYDASFYEKKFQIELISKGQLVNLDMIASALKEAISAFPEPLKEKDVTLILPQESFAFFSTDMPMDISPGILNSYLREKARSQTNLDIDNCYYDYLVQENEDKKKILFFALDKEHVENFEQPFKLLDLRITSILPESLTYFKLFEKTLRKDKRENIFYVSYGKDRLMGHVYDSFGLLEPEKWVVELKADSSVETILKDKALDYETQGKKLNRLILAGEQSENIRQDTFTKQVGVWTNPLKRIIPNFYQDYVKMLNSQSENLPILQYDACVGAFIFFFENRNFSLFSKQKQAKSSGSSSKMSMPSMPSISMPSFPVKPLLIFIVSFALSFGALFFAGKLSGKGLAMSMPTFGSKTTPTPTIAPTAKVEEPTPTPTPEIDKAEVRIKILNGTGIKGKAATVKESIKEKGYEDFVVGNADKSTYTITEIQIKESKAELKDILVEDLKEFVESPEVTTDLKETDAADVVIIIGKDFK
jgi:hypothetical protein